MLSSVVVESNQLAQIVDCRRYAVKEMLLSLKISTEAVSPQYLQCAEEHKERQAFDEVMHRGYFHISAQLIIVDAEQPTTQVGRIFCRSLPQKRSQIIVERSLATTLKIYEMGIAFIVNHHVARLKITIKEALCLLIEQVFGQQVEAGFELQLVEINLSGFQKAIFKIVQVEHHTVAIELRLRIAVAPVDCRNTLELHGRQFLYRPKQQGCLFPIIAASFAASSAYGIEQRLAAKIFLNVAHFVIIHSQHSWHWQLLLGKMLGKINECVVLLSACSYGSNNASAITTYHSEIQAVATRSFKLCYRHWQFSAP